MGFGRFIRKEPVHLPQGNVIEHGVVRFLFEDSLNEECRGFLNAMAQGQFKGFGVFRGALPWGLVDCPDAVNLGIQRGRQAWNGGQEFMQLSIGMILKDLQDPLVCLGQVQPEQETQGVDGQGKGRCDPGFHHVPGIRVPAARFEKCGKFGVVDGTLEDPVLLFRSESSVEGFEQESTASQGCGFQSFQKGCGIVVGQTGHFLGQWVGVLQPLVGLKQSKSRGEVSPNPGLLCLRGWGAQFQASPDIVLSRDTLHLKVVSKLRTGLECLGGEVDFKGLVEWSQVLPFVDAQLKRWICGVPSRLLQVSFLELKLQPTVA